MPKAARLLLSIVSLFVLPVSVFGQDESTDTPAEESSVVNDWDRLIYVPFDELQKVFDNQDASAVIPYAEYMEMLKTYLQRESAKTNSPDAVITESHFVGTVEQDVVKVTAELNITVMKKKGWAQLPVNFGKVAVGKITSDNEETTILRGLSKGRYQLLLNGAGQHKVTVELLATVKTSPEHRSFRIDCPPVGISDLTLTIPEADQSIEVSPLQVFLPVEGSDDNQTVAKASLGATDFFEVRWNPEAGSKPIMDLLASATNQTNVRIEPGLIQSTTSVNYEILRGELTDVSVRVPLNARIIDVVSKAGRVRSWKAEAVGESHQVVKVDLLTPATESFQLEIQTERTLEQDTVQLVGESEDSKLQGVHAEGVVRESGRIFVTTDSSLTAVVKSQSGVKRIEAAAKTKSAAQSARQAWEFSGTTGSLVLQIKPVEPRLLVDQNTNIVFSDDELRLSAILDYSIERAGVFQLNLQYPESLTIDTVRADGMSEFNVDKSEGKLTLSLTEKRLGKIRVSITAHQTFDSSAEGLETDIPSITPLGVERENGRLSVFAPRFLDVATVDEKVDGLFSANSPGTQQSGRAVQVSAYQYTQRPFTLAVQTTPRPAQLAASVATTASIEPDVVKVSSAISYTIQNAGIDTYRIAIPERLADDVRFRSLNPSHTIQQRDKGDAEDGWVTWTLVLQDEVTGTVQLAADWEVPLAANEDESAARDLTVEPVRVLAPFTEDQTEKRKVTLTQSKGEIRLLRHESLSIEATGEGETIEQVDVRELELLSQDGYLAFRYFSQPASVSISIRKHEIQEVVATVVSRAAFEVVTDKQPLANYRCRIRIISSERQRLLIYLPKGADLQAPLLNSKRTTFEPAADVEQMEGWDAYYVNISREGTSDEEFLLAFQFRSPITSADTFPYEGQGSKLILRLPLIGDNTGSTVIQETRTAVWSPDDISFVGEPRNWKIAGAQKWNFWNPMISPSSAVEAKSLNNWIGDNGGTGDFAQQGNVTVYRALGRQTSANIVWWNRPFLVAVICGALVLAGFILRRTSWENRLTLVVLGCLAVALWSLKDSSETLQFVSAGSLGLVAVAAIWIVGLFWGPKANSKSDHPAEPPPPESETSVTSPVPPQPGPAPVIMPATDAPKANPTPPGAVLPSPEVANMMDDLMGGKK